MAGLFLKRTAFILALVLVGWAGFVSWQQFERHERIEEEVAALQAEAQKIREENETFSERIGYFSTDAYREQEAKKKLGLKRADETVVVIKPAVGAAEATGEEGHLLKQESALSAGTHIAMPNYRKWHEIFFAARN